MAELAEEVVETAVRAVPKTTIGVVVGLAVGGVVGYFVAEKRLRTKYDEIMQLEVSEMRTHYQAKVIAMENKPALDGLVKDLGYVPAPVPKKEEIAEGSALTKARVQAAEQSDDDEVVKVNVFEQASFADGWDYEEEVSQRTPDYPYIIHADEQGELAEMDQLSFTYYEGDEILANEREEAVTDVEHIVGLANLDKFGHGSGEANILYVRNVKLGIEITIVRSTGRFDEEVLGLKHADEAFRKKRPFDDD